ncbi:succinate dehydrogenase [Bifidobacterium aemilianum]|uniref:succinate dehydrogenase n=1 Tax=Bifidobacterium aemilianum TaxID=2493120 RepID=A0A366KAY7_9BIFI|nr:FAD-binding protein [Bifidobacterium aemilianum]RBP98283.1 succinate dehydrogenase [Bifidobacterium aemilianum]
MSPKDLEDIYDVVIVGAGAAGLSAALGLLYSPQVANERESGQEPKILVVSKLQPLRSHTGSAEGGIAASLGNSEHDDWHWHYYDTVKGGDWLVDQDAARILAQEAPETVINLERSGVAFSRTDDGHIDQRRFGGHTADFGQAPVRRAAYAADRIGHQILFSLWQQCVGLGVRFAEEWYVSDLVLSSQHHSNQADLSQEAAVAGIVAFDSATGKVHPIAARQVLLATGGAGRLFHTTSNSWDLTGDGMALALEAGLQLEDMEFIQFHPTGLGHTGILLSEAARAEGATLRNAEGRAFMTDYAPDHGDLAARDVVSRSIMSEIDAGRGVADPSDPQGAKDCVWLDMTDIDRDHMLQTLPQVVETIQEYAGLDPTMDLVPVKPTAHYTMGGIPITTEGRVYQWMDGERREIQGLHAAGECSCLSVHGANRLGGNSLLDACLFGKRAGLDMAAQLLALGQTEGAVTARNQVEEAARRREGNLLSLLENQGADVPGDAAESASGPTPKNEGSRGDSQSADPHNAYELLARLGQIMETAVAVRCDQEGIDQALAALHGELEPQIKTLRSHSDSRVFNQEVTAIWEVGHLAELADVVLRASAARQESRGSLKRVDFPDRDDRRYLVHSMTAEGSEPSWQPVHILDMPPQARQY